VERPRGRTTDKGEIELDTYATFTNDDMLSELVMERMLAGVATRRHARVNEPVGAELAASATSTSRSSVSRRFKAVTQAGMDELMSRDLSELRLAALMLDGVHFAEACCVVALAILVDGTKVPVGLWLGDTENKTIGTTALIQRCTLHKRRNVKDHLPKDQRGWVDRRLAAAFNNDDAAKGERAARDLAAQLEVRWPDAAASLREGLEDMFTVQRLGINGRLAATLTNTNCIESMISIARDTTHNVKRWRDGKMIKRWCAAGMLNAERSFRRLKGHKQMPALVAALERHTAAITPTCDTEKAA
jgi:transposase-like protein